MATIKYKDPQTGEYKTVVGVVVKNKVVQTTGQSTESVMSQKTVSDFIPAQASPQNQLADKAFVNSSISTATATYQGSYNLVSDLSLTTQASHGQIEDALGTAISGADNNDYAFVQIPTSDSTPTEIASVERYKFNGTRWSFEYALNNSGFTAAQWEAVNSGITSGLVAKLGQLTGNTYSAANGLAGLFGFDNNGAWQNIVPSDLASVLDIFRFVENLPQGESYDNRLKAGIYVNGFPASGRSYGVCAVFSWANAYIFQLHRDPNGLASRISYDGGTSWSPWA